MAETNHSLAELELCLARLKQGDAAAGELLLELAYRLLQRTASRMMRRYPTVGRWDDTDDVWQAAAWKFYRALNASPPESVPHFYRLAGVQIRRTLIDLARKYSGPMGLATNHETHGGQTTTPDPTNDPVTLADWTEFHQRVELLPDDMRQVFDLLWYGGLGPGEVAVQLRISERTVRRRWREARLLLGETTNHDRVTA